MTSKIYKHKVPLYSYYYDVMFSDNSKEICEVLKKKYKYILEDNMFESFGGFVVNISRNLSILIINDKSCASLPLMVSYISHEAYHIACDVFRSIGANHEEECMAYVLDEIVERVMTDYMNSIKK